jgi:hypothetical protein
MQRYTVYLYLEIALHVSGGISIHHQEHLQLYLQHLVFVTTPLLLSAAIMEELEPVPTLKSQANFQILHFFGVTQQSAPLPRFTYAKRASLHTAVGRGSTVRIATRYGLDVPGIEPRWGVRFSATVKTGPGVYVASRTMGTVCFSRG